MDLSDKAALYIQAWRDDWCKFCSDVLKARLDKEQQDIIHSVQYNRMTAVASGTARGKDFCAACAAMCFMYLTPRWVNGRLVKNTKIAMTAPSGRQVKDIMIPEVSRLFRNAGFLPGRLLSSGIRTNYEEWFLTGFKSSDDNMEAWSGFHAVNTLFVVTEASGISEVIYNAIEDVEAAMKGMLDPVFEEKVLGHAEVRQTFKASGVGTIAGAYVLDGIFERNCSVRLIRDGIVVFDGPLASLKRFKDDVKEVRTGYECGFVFENYNDIKEGDQVEAYKMVETERK